MALYSLFKVTVLCALFHEAAAAEPLCTTSCCATKPSCTGNINPIGFHLNGPSGIYSAHNVPTLFHGVVKHVVLTFYPDRDPPVAGGYPNDVLYQLEVVGCLFAMVPPYHCIHKAGPLFPPTNFTGYWIAPKDNTGAVLIPIATPQEGGARALGPFEMVINQLFGQGIHWCPTENTFALKVPRIGSSGKPYCKLVQPKMMYATVPPYADTSGPTQGSLCYPGDVGSCGHGEPVSSGLTCKCTVFGGKETCTCQP